MTLEQNIAKKQEGQNCQHEKIRYQKCVSEQIGWMCAFSTTQTEPKHPRHHPTCQTHTVNI